jgi:hypothetical protein
MTTHSPIQSVPVEQLASVTGGNASGIANSIGNLVDQFAGTGGKATQIANSIGGLVDQFGGGGGGGE